MVQGLPIIFEDISTKSRFEMIDVTSRIQKQIDIAQVKSGMIVVHVAHTTAAITISENADPDVKSDIIAKLEKMIPQNETYYQHDEGNSDSHLKASLFGFTQTLLVESGKLLLGRWQGVFFCEFDGPRERRIAIKIINLDPRADLS